MRTQFSKLALTASLVLALTLTLSCSGGDEGGGTSSTSGSDELSSSSVGGGDNNSSSSVTGGGGGSSSSATTSGGGSSSSVTGGGNSSSSIGGGGSYTEKGNNIANYKTKQIDSQVWMLENLDYYVEGSYCYFSLDTQCEIFGRLYTWAMAMELSPDCNSSSCASQISPKHRGICPSGWHIPSYDEWQTLIDFAGGSSIADGKLKANSIWWDNNTGTDDYEFSALPGGYRSPSANFMNRGVAGFWWSATDYAEWDGEADKALSTRIGYNSQGVVSPPNDKVNWLSVRCIKDD